MSRIDANLATQIADNVRPVQSAQVIQNQAEAAQVRDLQQAAKEVKPGQTSAENLTNAAQQLKQVIEVASGKKFAFGLKVDDETKELVVEFKDSDGNVVKAIPSEEMRKLSQRLHDLVGMFVDKKA